MNTSWKTNLFGIMTALGSACAVLGPAGLGLAARDNDKTSEDVGAAPTAVTVHRISLLLALGVAVMLLTSGCQVTRSTVRYELGPDGKTNAVQLVNAKGPFYERAIMKHSTRFFGFQAKTDAKTQTPYVVLGFGSEVDEIIPTANGTNGISAPRTMSSFRLDNSINPFDTKIHEDSGAGDVYIGGSNDVSKAIVPAPYQK